MPDVVNTATAPYSWDCSVDRIAAIPLALPKLTEPTTIKICEFTDLADEPHVFDFDFNSFQETASASGAIYLDYIEYLPTQSATQQTFSFIAFSFDDVALVYDISWKTVTLDGGTVGLISGLQFDSTVQFRFNGS